MSQFSDNVKSLMLEKGISQTDLCLRTGIGKSNLSEYLSDKYFPKPNKLKLIAEALGVTTVDLMGKGVAPSSAPATSLNDDMERELLEKFRKLPDVQKSELMDIIDVKLNYWAKPDKFKMVDTSECPF